MLNTHSELFKTKPSGSIIDFRLFVCVVHVFVFMYCSIYAHNGPLHKGKKYKGAFEMKVNKMIKMIGILKICLLWTELCVIPPNSYAKILTLSTSECVCV